MSDFGERLKSARKKKSLTQRQLAELIGAKHNSISNWENQVNHPGPDAIARLCAALSVSPNDLMGGPSFAHPAMLPVRTRRRVPLLGGAACGEPIFKPGDGTEFIDIGDDIPCDFALRAEGDSMTGDRICDGDVVFFRAQDDVRDGEIAAVQLDDGMTIKRIKRLRSPDGAILFTQLLSSNAKYTSIDIGGENETRSARIVGRAVAFRAMLNT